MIPPRPAVIAHGKVLRVLKTAATKIANALPVCTVRPLSYAIRRVGIASRRLSFALGASEIRKIPLGDIQTKNYRSHITVGFDPTIAC